MKKAWVTVMIFLVLIGAGVTASAEEIAVPGGWVGEEWGIDLQSIYPDVQSWSLLSGPSWATLSADGVLSGTPQVEGEAVWEIQADAEQHRLSAYFWN